LAALGHWGEEVPPDEIAMWARNADRIDRDGPKNELGPKLPGPFHYARTQRDEDDPE
jgi:hypothetical protein